MGFVNSNSKYLKKKARDFSLARFFVRFRDSFQ